MKHTSQHEQGMHPIAMVLTVTLLALAISALPQEFTITGQAVPELSSIDTMMQIMMNEYNIRQASVAIAKDGHLVFARGYTQSRWRLEPVEPTAMFRTASIAKAITSIAIHQLIEQGLLTYNTRLVDLLDLSPPPGQTADPRLARVTVDHLLTHSGGWDREATGFDPLVGQDRTITEALGVDQPPTPQEIATYMTGQPLDFAPGSRWAYSNYGYLLLSLILEEVTGQSYLEYVQENVFRPAGVSRANMAHTLSSEHFPGEPTYWGGGVGGIGTWETALPAGGWVLAAPDLARLLSVLFGQPDAGGLLSRDSIQNMLAPVPVGASVGYGRGWFSEQLFFSAGHTLGWLTDEDDGLDLVGHSGAANGVHSLGVWRSDDITFVWFTAHDAVVDNIMVPAMTSWPDHDLWASVGIPGEPAGAATCESWIPVVSHASGLGGSVWRSDLGLLNRSSLDNQVRIRLYPGQGVTDLELELAAGEARTLTDIAGDLGLDGSAPLRVFSSEALSVTSRTYNQSGDGTYGQYLAGYPIGQLLDTGNTVVLMQLREDDSYRTNIGLVNTWRRPAEVVVNLHDGDGSVVTTTVQEIPAESGVQLLQPYRDLGEVTDISGGYAQVELTSGRWLLAYASVVDNRSNDPTTIPMKTGPGAQEQWIAVAAHADGAFGSQWRTDLAVLNRTTSRRTVEIVLHDHGADPARLGVELSPGEQRLLEDVVGQLGRVAGALEIAADGPVLATSRTFNLSGDGTLGQFLGGEVPAGAIGAGQTTWLPQLRQDAACRTNIGLLNMGGVATRVRIRLYGSDGIELAAWVEELEPGVSKQINQPFLSMAGAGDIASGYATVTVESESVAVVAYASVIDNATNDPTTIPMLF